MTFHCPYCEKDFIKETSLAVHLCEQKKRYQQQDEPPVKIAFQAYLRFYEITQGSSKLKTFEDFAKSPYYRAFVKFGRHCTAIRAVNIARFIDWLIKNNKKLDHWCRDSIYAEYLSWYLRCEATADALERAIEHSITWAEESRNPSHDYLRYGNDNAICYAVTTGRISAWIVYNCASGQEFLSRLNPEQLAMIWPMIDSDQWHKKFNDYPADREYVNEILRQAGW
jgi:hypothetical protein